jgi:hypothetical protein
MFASVLEGCVTSIFEVDPEDRGSTFLFCGEELLLPQPPTWWTVESLSFIKGRELFDQLSYY